MQQQPPARDGDELPGARLLTGLALGFGFSHGRGTWRDPDDSTQEIARSGGKAGERALCSGAATLTGSAAVR